MMEKRVGKRDEMVRVQEGLQMTGWDDEGGRG